MKPKTAEQIIKKHLGFQGKTDDKWWLQASVKHYLESGNISGSFHQAITAMMEEYKSLPSKGVGGEDVRQQLEDACYKALKCLYIAVDEPVAKDVNYKVKDYINYLKNVPQATQDGQEDKIQKAILVYSTIISKALYHSGMFEHAEHAKICDLINEKRSEFLSSLKQ